jgi:hypothetical protein
MPSLAKTLVTFVASDNTDFADLRLESTGEPSRQYSVFSVETTDHALAIAGTMDELIDFASAILGRVYSWPIVNHHNDWFDEADNQILGKAVSNGNGS